VIHHHHVTLAVQVAGTEQGITEPEATFSACFGGAFLLWHPMKYASMLAEKMDQHGTNAWLVNTGWTGGRSAPALHCFSLPLIELHFMHLDADVLSLSSVWLHMLSTLVLQAMHGTEHERQSCVELSLLCMLCRYGVGSRFKLKHTRSIINAIHSGELNECEYKSTPIFDLRVSFAVRLGLLIVTCCTVVRMI